MSRNRRSVPVFDRRAALRAVPATLVCLFVALPATAVDRLGSDVAKPGTAGALWAIADKQQLRSDIDALLTNAPTLRGAHVGLQAIDSRNGDVLYEHNVDDAFVPASTQKLLTGSVALGVLGPSYRFHTEAYLAPPNETLYVKAGGDPLLAAADIDAMARAAVVTGAFHAPFATLVDASAFASEPYPPGWSWDDFVYDYAPKLTPLPVDENALQVTIAPGKHVGDRLRIFSSAAGADNPQAMSEMCAPGEIAPAAPAATTGERGSVSTLDAVRYPPRNCFAIVGSLALGGKMETIGVALADPAATVYGLVDRVAAQQYAATAPPLTEQHVPSPDQSVPVPAGARLVWTHDGKPLSDLLADMWLPSDNFIAEMLLRAIGLHALGMPGTTAHGADAERQWLTGIGTNPATLTIADGSGLSSYDRITPRALVAILQADWNGPDKVVVLDDLPLAGVRGTLQHSFGGTLAERRTFAKTGSVNHARGLAGYLATLHHGAVTFAWSVDDWMGRDDDLEALRARVLSRIIGG